MDTEISTSISVMPETGQETGRRWLLGRRSGGVAVRGATEQSMSAMSDIDISGAEKFDIADKLADYSASWAVYEEVVDGFLQDEANFDTFNTVYSEKRGTVQDRSSRRRRDVAQDRDFLDLATIFVIDGRMSRTRKQDLIEDITYGSSELTGGTISQIKQANKQTNTVASKKQGLTGNFPPTPKCEELEGRLNRLSRDVAQAYKPILKLEDKIIEKLLGDVDGKPERAKQLIEEFIQAQGSEAAEDRIFVRFLATEHSINPTTSVLAHAIETVKGATEKGSVAVEYVESKLAENEGNNQLRFFADQLKSQGMSQSFQGYMAAQFETWPEDMRDDYEAFRNRFMGALVPNVNRIAGQNIEKLWLHPTIEMFETMIDRTFFMLHGKYANGTKKASTSHAPIRVGSSTVLRTEDVMPTKRFEEAPEPRRPVIVTQGLDGAVWGQQSTVHEVVQRLLPNKRKNDRKFIDEVEKLLTKLTSEPFGDGTQLLRGQNGNRTKFYRLNPEHANMSVRAAKMARIIFAVKQDLLGVVAIEADHHDYEATVANLVKAHL